MVPSWSCWVKSIVGGGAGSRLRIAPTAACVWASRAEWSIFGWGVFYWYGSDSSLWIGCSSSIGRVVVVE